MLTDFKCRLCNDYEGKNTRGLGVHIGSKHHISQKEYYDRFFKEPGEGICPICGKDTSFIKLAKGYRKHCCHSCAQLNPDVQLKLKETSLKKYGVDWPRQSLEVQEKAKKTNLEKYGAENYNNIEKAKTTCKEHYGVERPMQAEEIKEKAKQTCNKKYGVDNSLQAREVRLKAYETKKKNGTRSPLEEYLEEMLIANNIKYKVEYKEERYPYFCDFYLPETDTFIEIHGFWMHGKHFFNKNSKEDKNILNIWYNKGYTDAINCWTVYDLEKRDCAIRNNLNYVVLWNKKDIKNFINNYLSQIEGRSI